MSPIWRRQNLRNQHLRVGPCVRLWTIHRAIVKRHSGPHTFPDFSPCHGTSSDFGQSQIYQSGNYMARYSLRNVVSFPSTLMMPPQSILNLRVTDRDAFFR